MVRKFKSLYILFHKLSVETCGVGFWYYCMSEISDSHAVIFSAVLCCNQMLGGIVSERVLGFFTILISNLVKYGFECHIHSDSKNYDKKSWQDSCLTLVLPKQTWRCSIIKSCGDILYLSQVS